LNIDVRCSSCSNFFVVGSGLGGALTNCPKCGRATEVPGLRDPLWRLIQLGIGGAALLAGAYCWMVVGPVTGLAAAAATLGLGWAFSRLF
jgi:hypothetical protein